MLATLEPLDPNPEKEYPLSGEFRILLATRK